MKNILIIEDDPTITQLYEALVPKDRYMLTIAHRLADIPAGIQPSLIVLDLWLPNGQGLETIRHVRKKFPFRNGRRVPILVITAYTDVDVENLIEAGADDVLYKSSIPRDKLIDMIRKTIRRQEVWEEANEEWLSAECHVKEMREVLAAFKS